VGEYPADLVTHWQAPDGTPVTIRPVRAEDAEIGRAFVHGLSDEARYLRFMSALKELTPAMVKRFTEIDYEREMALVAVMTEGGREVQIAVARYVMNADERSCEFAIVVADRFHGKGLGQYLMLQLITLARARHLTHMTGYILARNARMLALAETLGFAIDVSNVELGVTQVRLEL
jgi:acetyltransferase